MPTEREQPAKTSPPRPGCSSSRLTTGAIRPLARRRCVRNPIRIIPPTVDDRLIQPMAEPPGPMQRLYSGNIGRKEGLDQLIDLAARLQQRPVQATVIIRADGNDRETLQQQAAAQALSNLRLEPLCPAGRLAEGLAEGHIHLVPQNALITTW